MRYSLICKRKKNKGNFSFAQSLSLGLRPYRPFTSFNNCALLAILIKYRVCKHGFRLFTRSRWCWCCTHRLLLHYSARVHSERACMCRHCCCRYVQHSFLNACTHSLTRIPLLCLPFFGPLHTAILSWFYFEIVKKVFLISEQPQYGVAFGQIPIFLLNGYGEE